MRQFRVISLSVGGRRKVHYYGEIVTEKDFPEGNCDQLVQKGFLQELESKPVAPVVNIEPVIEPVHIETDTVQDDSDDEIIDDEPEPIFKVLRNDQMVGVYTEADCELSEIKLELSRRGIDFDATSRSKKKLFSLLVK